MQVQVVEIAQTADEMLAILGGTQPDGDEEHETIRRDAMETQQVVARVPAIGRACEEILERNFHVIQKAKGLHFDMTNLSTTRLWY